MQDLNWHDLSYVLAVSRARTLAAAARLTGVNESTVARRIAAAERRLGARLFERRAGVLEATEAGAAAAAAAERMEREVQAVAGTVTGADQAAAGTVRVTAVPIVVNRLLVPAAAVLGRDHPGLRLELIAEPRDLSLTKREADIALRLARPQRELGAVARRLGDLAYAVYAPAGATPERLPWLSYGDDMAHLPQARWIAERIGRGGAPPLLVNDAEALVEGVKAGLGRSLLPVAVGDREPGLVRLEAGPPPPSRELWLMVHPDLRDLVRIRVVIDWLAATVRAATGGP